MSTYAAPLKDMRFLMNEIAALKDILGMEAFRDLDSDTVDSILDEAAKFAAEQIDPINVIGDRQNSPKWDNGVVTVSPEYKKVYKLFCENGWHAMPGDPEFGGQGLPNLVNFAVNEMWRSASIAFALCPMLTMGAVHAIEHHASDALKQKYLPKMVDGTWGGTMNLTEPQAGSDLTAIRTKAVPRGDGTYAITGTKIFITWGEHDMAENLIHLVLARLPNSDPGLKGISLFLVPKFLVNDDGSLGARNDLICSAIEHKLGIKGSATAVMSYGDKGGATGWLIGQEGNGVAYMFTMMNHARIHVGLEGIAVAERAYQHALTYARERIQGAIIGDAESKKTPKPILFHPDVRRLLMDMKARTEALRAVGYFAAGQMDVAQNAADPAARKKAQAYVELLTPIVKGWSTESSIDITSEGVQVHGGTGFIEETGAAQYYRDCRITAIYEGTTAIQANDYIGRKTAREVNKETGEVGFTARALYKEIAAFADELAGDAKLGDVGKNLQEAARALLDTTEWAIKTYGPEPQVASAGSVPYLKLGGIVLGGWLLAKSAWIAQKKIDAGDADSYYKGKIATTRYYAKHWLVQASAVAREITEGGPSVFGLDEPLF
ncbi:MAG: acyl-CoA dehydrogenase C-terminal domain-containing protein [Zoogloeaceae bacterium]|jgi:alkylation response protein AidB-like acyl-CoA dehydrogenase|nr:acyl-CoA dehydrogenase C-terminal domain-containing protein [Zoogloeaceae bacterium]